MRSEEGNREGRAGEHMNLKISIGSQDFAFLREHNCFWWIKLILLRMVGVRGCSYADHPSAPVWKNVKYEYVELLFSRQYEHRGDLFEGLNIWSDLKYRNIQGSYPVIYLSLQM